MRFVDFGVRQLLLVTEDRAPDKLQVDGAIEIAADGSHLHVLKWLYEHCDPVYVGYKQVRTAMHNGNMELARWLLSIVDQVGRDRYTQFRVYTDRTFGFADLCFLKWVVK